MKDKLSNREAAIDRVNYIFDQIGDDANIYLGMHLYRDAPEPPSAMHIALMDVVTVSDQDFRFGGIVKHRWMNPTHKLDFEKYST